MVLPLVLASVVYIEGAPFHPLPLLVRLGAAVMPV